MNAPPQTASSPPVAAVGLRLWPPAFGVLAALVSANMTACAESPYFESVLLPAHAYEPEGPHPVEAWVVCPVGVARLLLRITASPGEGRFSELPFELIDGDLHYGRWRVGIPGGPAGRQVFYYLVLFDREGTKVSYPHGAPETDLIAFEQLDPEP